MAGAASVCLKSRLLMATTGSCDRTRVFSAPPIYHRLGLVGCQTRAQTTSSSLGKNPKDVYTESTYPILRVFWEQDMGRAVCPPMDKEDFADRSRMWAAMAKGHRATFVRAQWVRAGLREEVTTVSKVPDVFCYLSHSLDQKLKDYQKKRIPTNVKFLQVPAASTRFAGTPGRNASRRWPMCACVPTHLSSILVLALSSFSRICGSWVSSSQAEPQPSTRARSFPVPSGNTPS